jgi:16S rRNA (guanine966-N2)-methyltransferase
MMATVRISGGEHRGRRVQLPKQHELRPTSDKARQAFFNIAGPRIIDANFLDLFSGTGIFSFEAISRGAAKAVAVEKSRKAAHHIKTTAEVLEMPVAVICDDAFTAMRRLGDLPFDIVYADPPYDFGKYDELIAAIGETVPLAEDAIVAVEHRRGEEPSAGGKLTRTRTAEYGSISITLFSREDP